MSIFQVSESLHLITSLHHVEEDEAEEDQKRRNKEVQADTLQSDLQCYEAVSQFGARSSVSFRMDSKPQPSSDLNIKLWDELQCCLVPQLTAQLLFGLWFL